jgi:hypothetical protein
MARKRTSGDTRLVMVQRRGLGANDCSEAGIVGMCLPVQRQRRDRSTVPSSANNAAKEVRSTPSEKAPVVIFNPSTTNKTTEIRVKCVAASLVFGGRSQNRKSVGGVSPASKSMISVVVLLPGGVGG